MSWWRSPDLFIRQPNRAECSNPIEHREPVYTPDGRVLEFKTCPDYVKPMPKPQPQPCPIGYDNDNWHPNEQV